jgi:hypothetical protein
MSITRLRSRSLHGADDRGPVVPFGVRTLDRSDQICNHLVRSGSRLPATLVSAALCAFPTIPETLQCSPHSVIVPANCRQ